jgi:predicted phage terminase large subunit-like protein
MPLDTTGFELTDKQKEVRAVFTCAARYFLVYGGSRSGKTFFICYAIVTRALMAPGSRHIIFRNDGVDAKQSVGNETIPKVVELAYPGLQLKWNDKDGYYELPNGAQVWLAGLKDKARLDKALGKEYATIYLNEASQITLEAFELVKSRLAQVVMREDGKQLSQKLYVDLNPTTSAHWTYQIFVLGKDPSDKRPIPDHDKDYRYVMVNPVDNMANLSQDYIRSLDNMPERQRRRFFEGMYNADDDNALWNRGVIIHEEPPELERIVVAVDPATTTNVGSDETGIVVAGQDAARRGYVLDDDSDRFKPEEWARRAISLYDTYDADCIVAEANQGGEMVASTIKAAARGRTIPVKLVHASRGKHIRAEPIAALYAQGKVRHAKPLSDLEDQMCAFKIDFDRKEEGYSPDRVDALVWALTELFPRLVKKTQRRSSGQSKAKARFF